MKNTHPRTDLTKTHRTALNKVKTQLTMRQKMNYSQIILGETNQKKFDEAAELIGKAINILDSIN